MANGKQQTYGYTELDYLLLRCCEYVLAEREKDKATADSYHAQLMTLLTEKFTQMNLVTFHHLIDTQIFRDAVGKVVSSTDDSVTVALEY